MKKFVVTVKKEFMDRRAGIKRKPGDVLKVDESRLKEIRRSGGDYVTVDKAATEKLNANQGKAETPADPKK
jgi:hypothetical protein